MLFLALTSALAQSSTNTHCRDAEQVLFHCTVDGGKQVSLCGSAEPGLTWAQYRFGASDALELTWPETERSLDGFVYENTPLENAARESLSFENAGYRYQLFETQGDGAAGKRAGVKVTKGAARVATLLCEGTWVSNLSLVAFAQGLPEVLAVSSSGLPEHEWPLFYERFRRAARAGDFVALSREVRFPLPTRGPMDWDPVISYTRAQFPQVMARVLEDPDMHMKGTQRDALVPDAPMQGVEDTRIDNLTFAFSDGRWQLVHLYVSYEFYEAARKLGFPAPPEE